MRIEEILMTIKRTIEHFVRWQVSGVTSRAAIYMPMCASRLTASASYMGRFGKQTFLDRRPNKI
jgi:hypothetical protein